MKAFGITTVKGVCALKYKSQFPDGNVQMKL